MKDAEQLLLPTICQGVMHVCQKLFSGHNQWDINPSFRQVSREWEKNLQFIVTCPIYLPQLSYPVSLIYILGQLVHPGVINQRPILGFIGPDSTWL